MGPKKAKKSKAELEEERLAREEEERKLKAAEEKRLAEEREKKRQEELKLQAELKAHREKQFARLQEEYVEIADEKKSKLQQLEAEERKEALRKEWEAYRDPSDEPNALIESDMNTFITLTREIHATDLKETIEVIRRIEQIATAVEEVWSNSLANRDAVTNKQALSQLVTLRDMIVEKINAFTLPYLRFADKYANDRTEINVEEVAEGVGFGIWASFSDIRPIRKSVQFESLGIQIDIPKQLLQQHEHYVYRVLRIPIIPYNLEPYSQLLQATTSPNVATSSAAGGALATQQAAISPALEQYLLSDPKFAALYSSYIVGDIFEFEILHAPSSAYQLRAKKWTFRDYSENSKKIRKSLYPSSVACRVFLRLPETLMVTDDMRMMVWTPHAASSSTGHSEHGQHGAAFSASHGEWSEEGISDYQYSEKERAITFYLTTTGTLALVKKRNVHLPLKSWALCPVLAKPVNKYMNYAGLASASNAVNHGNRVLSSLSPLESSPLLAHIVSPPVDKSASGAAASVTATSYLPPTYENHARLSLNYGPDLELVIDIIGRSCYLVRPETPVFSDLLGKPFSPGLLLRRLQRKGINLLALPIDFLSPEDLPGPSGVAGGRQADSKKRGKSQQGNRPATSSGTTETPAASDAAQPSADGSAAPTDTNGEAVPPADGANADGAQPATAVTVEVESPGVPDDNVNPYSHPKHEVLEREVLYEISQAANAFDFINASEWNRQLNHSQIGIFVRESSIYTNPTEFNDFDCVLVERDEVSVAYQNTPDLGVIPGNPDGIQYTLVVGNDYGKRGNYNYSTIPYEVAKAGQNTANGVILGNDHSHFEMTRTLKSRITTESIERMKHMNQSFAKTIFILLDLIRIFSQS